VGNLKHLPVVQEEPRPGGASSAPPPHDEKKAREKHEGSLGKDGRRRRPYPADLKGRWLLRRRAAYVALIGIWAALPWIPIGGHPAVFLDVEKRQFFLFGMTFNAQDIWLVFFGVTGLGFGLLYATALLGRVWCGWACPQTVFLEALFRPAERLINGPRNVALKREQAPLDWSRLWRIGATHALYFLAALFTAHVFLAYFVSIPKVFEFVRGSPGAHPEAFAWMVGVTALFYVNFGIFREQFCVVMCPYGRLQSVLLDDDSLVIGYDEKRGEPRAKGKVKTEGQGDCVDCSRCVVVCPTNIDIRDGLQLDCIACTACIDACDEVMDKLSRPRGLIRYDSLNGLRGEARRVLRPRVYGYTVLLILGVVVATTAFRKREPFEANILRLPGVPYTRDGTTLRDAFEIHVVNKSGDPASFDIEPVAAPDLSFIIPMQKVTIEPLGSRRVPVFVTMEQAKFKGDLPFVIHVRGRDEHGKEFVHDAKAVFLGAR
jgi:cytochrome c oxidase accessory protein FixG